VFQPDENTLFLSALDVSENPRFCYTVRELTMLALINELTDLPDWDRKVFDPDFTFDWKSQKLWTGKDITRSMLDWCVEEVKYYVHDFIPSRIIPSFDGGAVKSDDCVDRLLREDLERAAASLRRAVVEGAKTPISAVVDIVDPYLFPFAFGTTRTLREGQIAVEDCIPATGHGEPVKKPLDDERIEKERARYPNTLAWSNRFQWLPFDVTFDNRGAGGPRYVVMFELSMLQLMFLPQYRKLL
jgi:hypothetical protein